MKIVPKTNSASRKFLIIMVGILAVGALLLMWQLPSGGSIQAASRGGIYAAANDASTSCRVGGPPSLKARRVNSQMGELIAGPIVIGCGRFNSELIQLVAFHTSKQLCVELERPNRKSIDAGQCKPSGLAWSNYCADLCIFSALPADLGHRRRYRHSIISGQASPKMKSLKVVIHGTNLVADIRAIEGRVESDELLEALHETEPFLAFGVLLPRCVAPRSVEVVATSGNHTVKQRGVNILPHPCVSPPLPSPPQ